MVNDDYKPLRYRARWFCYLDLLGFTALVHDESIQLVIPLYKKALQHLRQVAGPSRRLGLIYSWFSDTFIIYSRDDTERDFSYVEHVGRVFFQSLILNRIAVRGAITHGRLYSQSLENVFIGPALIDAYHYAEKQDWLGFILTPAAYSRLQHTHIRLDERVHYRLVTDQDVIRHEPSTPVYAFTFSNGTVNGKNPYLEALTAMQESAPEVAKSKYVRTIAFAQRHTRVYANADDTFMTMLRTNE